MRYGFSEFNEPLMVGSGTYAPSGDEPRSAYDFQAIHNGRVKRRVIPHSMAYGSSFFFYNLRRAKFQDIRVRQALSMMFDFEWSNRVIFYNAYKRSTSYFPNTSLQAAALPEKRELEVLNPLEASLPSGLLIEPFIPINTGRGDDRQPIKTALALLREAGWNRFFPSS